MGHGAPRGPGETWGRPRTPRTPTPARRRAGVRRAGLGRRHGGARAALRRGDRGAAPCGDPDQTARLSRGLRPRHSARRHRGGPAWCDRHVALTRPRLAVPRHPLVAPRALNRALAGARTGQATLLSATVPLYLPDVFRLSLSSVDAHGRQPRPPWRRTTQADTLRGASGGYGGFFRPLRADGSRCKVTRSPEMEHRRLAAQRADNGSAGSPWYCGGVRDCAKAPGIPRSAPRSAPLV